MTNATEFDSLAKVALNEMDDPTRTRIIDATDDAPRFERFHAGLSICSQKVRAVLAEKVIPYVSHEMVIVGSAGIYSEDFRPAENY